MNPFLSGAKAVLLGIVTRLLTNAFLLVATWLTAKGWLTQVESGALSSMLLTVGVALAGMAIDWAISRPAVQWVGEAVSKSDVRPPLVLLVGILLLGLVGCAATPRERYPRAAAAVTAAWDVGHGLYAAGKIPEPVWQSKIKPNLDRGVKDVIDAHAWIEANPALADTPYAPCPPLDDLRQILPELISLRFSIFPVPLKAPAPPASQPVR